MTEQSPSSRKPSRQQLRAQAREKRDANGWIAALATDDPWMKQSIRAALDNRRVTRGELEEALGMSLASAMPAPTEAAAAAPPAAEPERIALQHILISFAGAGTSATRTEDDARRLAAETLAQVREGADFGTIVQERTDDAYPGIYRLCNRNVAPTSADEFPRDQMVPAFGDVGFRLAAGEVGIANYDRQTSPFGWHIIKRLE